MWYAFMMHAYTLTESNPGRREYAVLRRVGTEVKVRLMRLLNRN